MAAAVDVGRDQVLRELKGLKAQNTQRLQALDERIKTLIGPQVVAASLNENDIDKLNDERQERLLRQELIDRLLFQVDTRFRSGDIRQFLSERLADMARTDLLAHESKQTLWKQMSYLSQALRDLPERGDNIVAFVDGYLTRSSFKRPLKPEDYLRSRQYTNGREAVAAAPANQEQIGEQLEKRLNELEQPSATTSPQAPVTN